MTELKKCTKCLIIKPINFFYKNKKSKDGFRSNCVECMNQYKLLNKDKIKEQVKNYNSKRKVQKKLWAEKNKDKVNKSREKWKSKNIESRNEYVKSYNKDYYEKNKKTRLEYSKQKQKEYRKNNPLYKIKSNLRRRINRYITSKTKSTELILGITYDEFIVYLESKFTEGMSLDKIGKEIHIDHIIPLSSAKTEEELYKLCHYTNLQPLWAKDNLVKSNKLDYLLIK
jgi:hypothetical protein